MEKIKEKVGNAVRRLKGKTPVVDPYSPQNKLSVAFNQLKPGVIYTTDKNDRIYTINKGAMVNASGYSLRAAAEGEKFSPVWTTCSFTVPGARFFPIQRDMYKSVVRNPRLKKFEECSVADLVPNEVYSANGYLKKGFYKVKDDGKLYYSEGNYVYREEVQRVDLRTRFEHVGL